MFFEYAIYVIHQPSGVAEFEGGPNIFGKLLQKCGQQRENQFKIGRQLKQNWA